MSVTVIVLVEYHPLSVRKIKSNISNCLLIHSNNIALNDISVIDSSMCYRIACIVTLKKKEKNKFNKIQFKSRLQKLNKVQNINVFYDLCGFIINKFHSITQGTQIRMLWSQIIVHYLLDLSSPTYELIDNIIMISKSKRSIYVPISANNSSNKNDYSFQVFSRTAYKIIDEQVTRRRLQRIQESM